MYQELKQRILAVYLQLPKYSIVAFTWGNVSEIDRELGVIAIKSSGVEYDMIAMQNADGTVKSTTDLITEKTDDGKRSLALLLEQLFLNTH